MPRAGRRLPTGTATAGRRLSGRQHPFVAVFGCADSRVPPELVFDCGLGDVLAARTAGHVANRAVLGSLQFGVLELEIPLTSSSATRIAALSPAPSRRSRRAAILGRRGRLPHTANQAAVLRARRQAGDPVDNTVRATPSWWPSGSSPIR
ncbi:MAG: carbonic anhydrase [Acidimicrobiales bacterium]